MSHCRGNTGQTRKSGIAGARRSLSKACRGLFDTVRSTWARGESKPRRKRRSAQLQPRAAASPRPVELSTKA